MQTQENVNGIGVSTPIPSTEQELDSHKTTSDQADTIDFVSRFGTKAADSTAAIMETTSEVDFGRFRLDQGFDAGAIQEMLPQVRKPTRHNWFMAKADPSFHFATKLYEAEDRTMYLVAPALQEELEKEMTARVIVPCLTRQGSLLLWPVRLPDDSGQTSSWTTSGLAALRAAMRGWIRIVADVVGGEYRIHHPRAPLDPPEWPDLSLHEMLKMAFREGVIESRNHRELRRLRGEV